MLFEKDRMAYALFPIFAIASLIWLSSAWALLLGMAGALLLGNPYLAYTRKITHGLLALSVIGLGAGMDLRVVGRVGAHGLVYTMVGIAFTFIVGFWLGRRLKTSSDASLLISAGTAICGGSAIAAVSSAIRARQEDVSVSLATVFFLNATALILFPWVGHQLDLDQVRFGLWSALAIHDTSSVVGAALQYGTQAVQIATTVKLARALWIVPVAFVAGMAWKSSAATGQQGGAKAKRPWFILGFVLAAALVTWVPSLHDAGQWVAWGSTRLLVLTLFLIGCGLTRTTIQNVGWRPLLQGFLLWVVVASASLAAILRGWIR